MSLPGIWLHLDLKGAPPKPDYLLSLLPFVKNVGITGILMEYEDRFPFASPLLSPLTSHQGTYSLPFLSGLLSTCKDLGLEVVPLVQTCGHLSYALSDPSLAHLRELPLHPECLRLDGRSPEVYAFLETLLGEVLSLHGPGGAIHVGGDEVWHAAKGEEARKRIDEEPGVTAESLYLDHMEKVVAVVGRLQPGTRVLLWDDMLRTISLQELMKRRGLREATPVVWCYEETLSFPDDLWPKYAAVFSSLSVAGAFKGASSSCAHIPLISKHVLNTLAWKQKVQELDGKAKVDAFILTGWQRFDYFGSLCELLPAGLPSLVCCVKALRAGAFTVEDLGLVSSQLGFDTCLPSDGSPFQGALINPTKFPGAESFLAIQRVTSFIRKADLFLDSDYVKTWCSEWHFKTRRVSLLHAKEIVCQCQNLEADGLSCLSSFAPALNKVVMEPSAEEWLDCYFSPVLSRIKDLGSKISVYFSTE